MTPYEYLQELREDIPAWLDQFRVGDKFSCQKFLGSRVVFYPGSGTDGHPVKMFGSTHSAHCFVYADYGVPQATLEAELARPTRHFFGYHELARLQLDVHDLVPNGLVLPFDSGEMQPDRNKFGAVAPFGFLEVLERDQGLDDSHGARRLAILFLGADGIATYNALFCQRPATLAPFAVVLQDHGYGGNYDRFGRGGSLDRIASHYRVLPRLLLVGQNTECWDSFVRIEAVEGDPGGMHATPRFLYERREK